MEQGGRYPVHPGLQGVLSHYYVIRKAAYDPIETFHLSPNLEMMLVFNFGPPIKYGFGEDTSLPYTLHQINIVGPLRKMLNYEVPPAADLLILPFQYNGFYRLFHASLDVYDEKGMSASDAALQAERVEDLWKMLASLEHTAARIAVLDQYLLKAISSTGDHLLPLLDHIDTIHDTTLNPVKVIAAKTALTERSVQLQFKKYVGYSLKELTRFLRFKSLLAEISNMPFTNKVDWFGLIVKYNYHDQSHLIKDFKYFTGVTPRQFMQLNADGYFCIGRD
ncbi:AraC-like DNA-binding protein [Chitinophaga skermanii]|uniref:AraC-like DNA-binding protein n=1 Tax=Chitinophaga skermanii TaxID=331697 RepID=A0A327RB09_9BACT|nr:helix-turn-helix domain-containing protein [Chitinophaga skermanii]RAJ11117.1 AraC-like DNA-binding protein [Chitinophaga skermanii]